MVKKSIDRKQLLIGIIISIELFVIVFLLNECSLRHELKGITGMSVNHLLKGGYWNPAHPEKNEEFNFRELNIKPKEAKKYVPPRKNLPRFPLNCSKKSKNPDLYWELKKNFSQFFNGYSCRFPLTKIKINSDGFRDKEYSREKPDNVFRIIALGDSITFGWGVNNSEIWTEVLERKLNRHSNMSFQVLNFGVWGYNTRMEVETFEEKAMGYNPDLVVIQFHRNDNQNYTKIKKIKRIYKKQLRNKTNLSKQEIRIAASTKARKVERSFRMNQKSEYELEMVSKSLKRLNELVKGKNISVLIATWPVAGYQEKVLKNISRKYEWYYINLWDRMKMNRNLKRYAICDGHPNSQGHGIMAENIYDCLKRNSLIRQ